MNLEGSETLNARVEDVWQALFDRAMQERAIPGCETLEQASETEFSAVVKLKIGPVAARFKGDVELTDIEPLKACTLSGKGNGGIAGFAKGHAKVRLEAQGDTTILHYQAEAAVGGKLAALGSRLIDSTAQKLAGEYFARFAAALSEGNEVPSDADMCTATAP